MSDSGYSGSPLEKKLGIKEGYRVKIIDQPKDYFMLFSSLPEGITEIVDEETKVNFIHYFTKDLTSLKEMVLTFKGQIEQDGMIWISWPKQSSKIKSDLNGNSIRAIGLEVGLVDVKVCSINEIWSALKFVIPVKDRLKKS